MKIYKDRLVFIINEPIELVIDGDFLTVELQQGKLVYYFESSNGKYRSIYDIMLCETGADIEMDAPDWEYIKTIMLYNGEYVLHVYCRRKDWYTI